jgi:hypothetical protein
MATANLNDMATIATDTVFGNRVFMAMIEFCTVVLPTETITSATAQIHLARKQFAGQILNNPSQYKPLFINAVAANQIVANDATASGTVVGLSPTALATATLLCIDTDINNAVASAFNAFIGQIG